MEDNIKYNYDIFLSFSTKDTSVARKIWQQLSESDLLVFWSDTSLKKELGESWFDKVEESLEKSQHMVLLITKNSLKSKWVLREYKAFLHSCYEENKRRLIPLLDNDIKITDLPLFMREFQTFRLGDPGAIKRLGNLIREYSLRLVKTDSENYVLNDKKTTEIDSKNIVSESSDEDTNIGMQDKKQITIVHEFGSFTDPRDNKSYKTIKIGKQTWFAENLNFESENSKVYKNKPELSKVYGRLYTWEDALSSCPDGWQIPDYYDWDELINYLGGYGVAGGKLIFPGNGLPQTTGSDTDNKGGFYALYGGMSMDKTFVSLKRKAYFWSADEYDVDNAWRYALYSYDESVNKHYREKSLFFSVRCIQKQ